MSYLVADVIVVARGSCSCDRYPSVSATLPSYSRTDEMAKLYAKYPDDVDVIAVYADATMVLKPWALWRKDDVSGEVVPADDNTLKVKGALARVSEG